MVSDIGTPSISMNVGYTGFAINSPIAARLKPGLPRPPMYGRTYVPRMYGMSKHQEGYRVPAGRMPKTIVTCRTQPLFGAGCISPRRGKLPEVEKLCGT